VLGEGIAATLGGDFGKKALTVGDHFNLGDRDWVVTGVLKSEGSTFGSEVWAKQSLVGPMFRKEAFTTLVLRAEDDSAAGADALAYDLRTRFSQVKLRAVPETEYYADLSKTNRQFLVAILVVAAIMAIGGIFGVMNTMFAAISQRTKDIGMLRLLGFKRWQVLVSFMLESLAIAAAGGLVGCALGYLSNGWTATSIISAGQGSGKMVVLRLIVDTSTVLAGLLFTLVMGRLGGLVPALSAMRLRVLESLR
jgi:ABC-type antimicrobial peptide transport system permease subunit